VDVGVIIGVDVNPVVQISPLLSQLSWSKNAGELQLPAVGVNACAFG
jgi:hypothetical protein